MVAHPQIDENRLFSLGNRSINIVAIVRSSPEIPTAGKCTRGDSR